MTLLMAAQDNPPCARPPNMGNGRAKNADAAVRESGAIAHDETRESA
jgi:hypothetical protein